MQARVELRRLKWLKRATWAVGVIKKFYLGWQVRKAMHELRQRRKEELASVVVQKYFRGWKARLRAEICSE